MALMQTIKMEEAEGEIQDSYSLFMETAGMIPKPMEMFSVSPELYKRRLEMATYYRSHPTLDFTLLTCIRYAVASSFNSTPCMKFNGSLLKRMGMEEKEIKKLSSHPETAPLSEREKAMLVFVPKALTSPDLVTEEDIHKLNDMGWTDRDIFDAVNHGSITFISRIMMNIFKMDD